ncbi:MAG: hypothetical protein QOI51_332 [Nocardioidaceae bacterium]|jgi:hypothetical protein|nr:hypothetical protein [Nocardioidaceae bacterium]
MVQPGNAGSSTAADHVAVLEAALAQLPVTTKMADPGNGEWMLARADSAGCSHGFIEAARARSGVLYRLSLWTRRSEKRCWA